MRIVLDTNVLVSGLLKPFGPCGQVVRILSAGHVCLCIDARILLECGEVLRRPRLGFDQALVEVLLEYIEATSEVHGATPLSSVLPDPDDAPFLEVAASAGADCLVTGNLRHFPRRHRGRVPVVSPQQFLDLLSEGEK